MSQLPTESTEKSQIDGGEQVAAADATIFDLPWQRPATAKFCAFVNNKAYSDGVETVFWPKDMGLNVLKPVELSLDKCCWWLRVPEGALGVLVLPFKYHNWYAKHKDTLGLPDYADNLRGVWFANFGPQGIPQLAPMMGVVNATWSSDKPLQIWHLEQGSSNAIQRQHHHWGQIAMSLWCATAFGLTQNLTEAKHDEFN